MEERPLLLPKLANSVPRFSAPPISRRNSPATLYAALPKGHEDASTERFLRYQHENAYLLAKGNPMKPSCTIPDVLEWKYTGNNLHPTQKPVCILTPLIECFSVPGDVVLDPFCGSGSTLVAAQQSGRRYIGIELSKRYFDLAEHRLR